MAAPFLEIRGLTKRFGRTDALSSVDLDVGGDELVVVLGPTGAGKSTLLRTIAGLERPDAGLIRVGGCDVTADPPALRDVALVFQNFSLYPRWTVRRNLEFPLRAPGRNLKDSEIDERVGKAAATLRIEELLDRPASRLSGGEMQRVAIGRAIVRRPRLFLLDEPLTNLDAKLREALRLELVELRRSLRTPMIFVTHDQTEALSMSDRILVLKAGRILQTGTPEEVYRRPVTPEVARQLGQPAINLLAVRRQRGMHVTGDGVVTVPARDGDAAAGTLGIRPEDIEPFGGPAKGKVVVVEDLGAERTLLVRMGSQEIHILVGRGRDFRPGDEVAPSMNPERAILWPGADAGS